MDNNLAPVAPPTSTDGKKLLIVEDDFFMNDLYRMEGVNKGFVVETCSNGAEAIDKAPNFMPDIILLDLMLPKADGIEVVTTLRSMDQFKQTPIVIITNVDDAEVEKKARAAGATDYVLKIAYTPDMVTNKLQSYFPKLWSDK